jgi:hypothetical protein
VPNVYYWQTKALNATHSSHPETISSGHGGDIHTSSISGRQGYSWRSLREYINTAGLVVDEMTGVSGADDAADCSVVDATVTDNPEVAAYILTVAK